MVFLTDICEPVKWCWSYNWQTYVSLLNDVVATTTGSADWAPRRPWSTPGWTVTGSTWTCWLSWRPSGWGSVSPGGGEYIAVLRIRIRIRIHIFLGLLDPDPLVRGLDPTPTPGPVRILLSLVKNSKKNLDFYCFVTSFWLFIFEKWCKSTFKK